MKWLIICGGSGSTQLYNGIKKFDKEADIKFLINMYDDGKSTGEVRKVMNVLGPSDCRKTHIKCYKNIHSNDISSYIIDFYDKRYDLDENPMEQILSILDDLNLSRYKNYVYEFFTKPESKNISYKDFNISNLIYSVMYNKFGYDKANQIICEDILKIENPVVLNSFDNVYLKAKLESGRILETEGEIVSYNEEDPIQEIIYSTEERTLNSKALELIESVDNIVISTGTFWSSLLPTIEYANLYKFINNSRAKKFWILNTIEDKDSKGISSLDFYNTLDRIGLHISEFNILNNLDATPLLQFQGNEDQTVYSYHFGNINGKHDSKLLASCLYLLANNLDIDNTKYLVLDFDDTIYSRTPTDINKELSKKIFKCLKIIGLPVYIVSGNTYKSISDKLKGINVQFNDILICANANSEYFYNNKSNKISLFEIKKYKDKIINFLKDNFNLEPEYSDDFHIKYKYLNDLERNLLAKILFDYFEKENIPCKGVKTGKTTIDILNKSNDKITAIKQIMKNDLKNIMYIGDEIYEGNDSNIPTICDNYFNVTNLYDTFNILEAIRTIKKCDLD